MWQETWIGYLEDFPLFNVEEQRILRLQFAIYMLTIYYSPLPQDDQGFLDRLDSDPDFAADFYQLYESIINITAEYS